VTRTPLSALLTTALTRQAAAAVSVERIGRGNLLPRCGLHSAGAVGSAAQGASAPRGRRGAGAYCGGRPLTACCWSLLGAVYKIMLN